MKNSNLLNRLLSYSHEKRTPQRLIRYAVMLLMLLALGVGQMWADPYNFNWHGNVFFRAPDNWDLSTNSTVQVGLARTTSTSTSTYCFYFGTMTRVGSTRLYYCWISADHGGWNQNEYIFFTANSSAKSAGDRKVNSHACYTAPYNYGVANDNCPYLFNPTSESNGASVSGTCYTSGSEYKDRWYPLLDKAQTVNLYTNGSSSNTGGSVTIAGTYMSAANTTTTTGSATSSTTSVNYTTLIGSSVSLTATPTTGYQFDGWYTAGTGGDLVSSSNPYSYTCTGAKTVYARFSYRSYSIAYKDKGGSDYSGSNGASLPSSYTYGTGIATLTAGVKSGYVFDGWYDNESCTGDPVTSISSSATGNKTFYAKFTQIGITLTAETGGEVSKDGSNWDDEVTITGISFNTAYNIYAQASTGYTFSGWTKGTNSGNTTINTGVTPNTVSVSSGAVTTITAGFSETMSSLSTSCSYDAGNPSYAAPSVTGSYTNVGYATTRTITATAAGTGYTFAGWTLTNCTRTDGGGATANPITIRSNGDGAAATVVANYTEVLTTDWKVIGDNQSGSPFGDNYSYTNGKAMSKKTGHSTEHNAYVTINVTKIPGDNYGFKVASSSSDDDKWGYGTGDGAYITFNRSASGVSKQVYSGLQHQLKFVPDGLGEYEFRVHYPDNKYVYVYFPTNVDAVAFGSDGHGTVTAKYNSVAFNSGTKVERGKTVRFTQSENTGYSFKEWNTNSTGTGSQLSTNSSYYDRTVAATNNVYAIYNAKTYTITLHDEDATSAGTGSVTATYNSSSLSSAITNPGKTGYTFDGWWSAIGGGSYNVIGTSGTLQASKSGFTNSSSQWTKDGDADLYAKWNQTVTLDGNGAGSSDGSVDVVYKKAGAVTSTFSAAARTGYTCNGYYTTTSGGYQVFTSAGVMNTYTSNIASWVNSSNQWCHAGATTLYAQWTAKTYTVTLAPNGGSGSNQTVTATYDATMPAKLSGGGDIVAPTRTGYDFDGYWYSSTQYYDEGLNSVTNWNRDGATTLNAKWDAKSYTVTLDVDEANKGTIAGADGSASVTFDAAPSTIANRPTAANGYASDGYYTDHDGEGLKVINGDGTWISDVAGYMSSGNWVYDGEPTLYAYYKKAEITELTLAAAIVGTAETDSITVTPTIDPTPTGTTIVCWDIQYSNGTSLPTQPNGRVVSGNTYRFKAPTASATYIIKATLRTGSSCGGGTELSTLTTTFQVAGEHTVTIRYQDSEGRTLAASTEITGKPLEWTENGDITPPSITGYTFHHWLAGDGITLSEDGTNAKTGARADSSGVSNIYIKANYDGTLTAVYNKKKMIFFNNTLGWSDVYVYFYNTNKYWSGDYGSGAKKDQGFGEGESEHPYWEEEHGHMTQIEGTNIWYFDYEGASISTRANVVFTEANQHDSRWFWKTKAARRSDHVASLQMFVPLTTKTETKNETDYYSSGYWMNYPENTGYWLKIYNQTTIDGATKLYDIPFVFPEDYRMPMELVVDLEAGQTYGFEIARADGNNYRNTGTMTANSTNWPMEAQSQYCGLRTTAAGDYTFRLYYSDSKYRMDVTYPVAVNDYRIVYTDLATWSKDAHTASWNHPSRVITKNSSATETKKDTVSFFWTYGSTPAIAYQTCSAVAAGSASWSASTNISVSSYSSVLNKKGIYNFILEQPAGGASISLVGVEPYTGNFYIRTDCAGSTKWSNFQSTDHQMTYSDYAEANSGYSHYYTHWVTTGQNVKFCIANDYSPCITDTLVEDKGTVIADITTEGNANAGRLNSGNASIRFMWDQAINKISRAYISGSSNISDRFLVLEGDAKMFDASGNPLSISGLNANEINLVDDQNFVYEREIKVQIGAKAKLTAKYNTNIQYFKGGSGTTSEDSVELLGGAASATKHTMRIVYDFKTNRLVTAYVPSDTIKNALAINADLMIVREHQEAGQQLVFKGEGALSEVHTVYGVMRFNRWTLNNKETTGGHSPVGDPKSPYERGLYWISFPFDVKLSDVFGFGTYGTHWIIMEYDGAARAKEGYWSDSEGFWKYVMPSQRSTYTLESGKGYVLALDLDLMKDNNTDFWNNNIEQIELFFPSAAAVNNIQATNITTSVDSHECTIDRRTDKTSPDINKDRTRADSHWNMIGIPSYANYGEVLKDGEGGNVITWNSSPYTNDLPFLYEWSTVDNSYSVQSGTTYPFKSMHAYMVQYAGDLYWSLASATPPSIVARSTYAEKPESVEMRIELQQNEMKVDQTFVKLSNDENASANFAFDEDLCKEFNANKANIYTIVENYLPVAGNTMPMSEQTTVVPVGVRIAADGDYTFAIPDGTEGIGITLIDNETGIRTSLTALEYTINLSAGDYADRFVLEISPISQISTDIEAVTGDELQVTGARKIMIDGLLYIVKDGKLFDAQGKRVQ